MQPKDTREMYNIIEEDIRSLWPMPRREEAPEMWHICWWETTDKFLDVLPLYTNHEKLRQIFSAAWNSFLAKHNL